MFQYFGFAQYKLIISDVKRLKFTILKFKSINQKEQKRIKVKLNDEI